MCLLPNVGSVIYEWNPEPIRKINGIFFKATKEKQKIILKEN
jgi:hypothetical protein